MLQLNRILWRGPQTYREWERRGADGEVCVVVSKIFVADSINGGDSCARRTDADYGNSNSMGEIFLLLLKVAARFTIVHSARRSEAIGCPVRANSSTILAIKARDKGGSLEVITSPFLTVFAATKRRTKPESL